MSFVKQKYHHATLTFFFFDTSMLVYTCDCMCVQACEQWTTMDDGIRPDEAEHPRLQQKLCAAYSAHFCDNT